MSILKRPLAVLLSLILILSMLPVAALASDEFTATVGTATVDAGKTVNVTVSLTNNPGFSSFEFDIQYDTSKLKLTRIRPGLILKDEYGDPIGSLTPNAPQNRVAYSSQTALTSNGDLLILCFQALSSASGNVEVKIQPNSESAALNQYGFATSTAVVTKLVPGTITVNGSTTDRTVTFMNGMETFETATVANGGMLERIPKAPAATNGQSFLGWYAVSGSDCLLDSVDETIIGTEASTETAIYTDTTYQAIWASSAMIAAGFAPKDGKTKITGISQSSDLQTLVTNCNGGTVKLLQNVELGSTYLTVASGETLTLDLNGKTLSGNGYIDTDNNGHGVILNNGTLALISGAETRGKIALADGGQSWGDYGAVENKGLITRMEKIDVAVTTNSIGQFCYGATAFNSSGSWEKPESVAVRKIDSCSFSATKASAFTQSYGPLGEITNSTFTGGYYADEYDNFSTVVLTNETLTLLKDCTITNNQSGGEALYIGFDSTIGSIEGCTITGPNGIVINGNGTSNTSVIKNLSADITANNGYALTVKNSKAEIAITGGKYKGSAGLFNTQSNTTTITYPEGKTLLEGADGYWALSEGYNVYFRNWDGTLLQQVSCAANGTAAYTGETPIRGTDENYVYTFSGWNTQKDGSGTSYTGDTIKNVTSDLTLYAQYTTVSARVVTLEYSSGSISYGGEWLEKGNYSSLKAAVDALNSNDGSYNNVVITLNEDAVETSTVEVKKSVTLDLNGQTLTIDNSENGLVLDNGAKLTVKDSSEAGTGVYRHTADNVQKSAILANGSGTVVNIESGTIEATTGNALTVDAAAFHVSGGMISGGQNGICVKTQNSSPECTISNGKILCSGNGYALYMDQSVAQYIKLSGGAFKNTFNTTEPIRKFDGQIKCTFQDGKSLSPSPNTEGFYEVREVGTYTFVLKADKEHYNAGETVTVTVSAYGPGKINSFGFAPSYDSGKLELESVTSANDGNFTVNPKTGMSGYTVNGKNSITLGNKSDTATELVTITFTAKENINSTTTITLMDLEMTPSGSETSDKAVVEKKLTVNLHDIRVTLTAGNGTINGVKEDVTLYAKYNVPDLYSDAARKKPATVEARANEGYRLNNKQGESLWLCGDTGYASFDVINGLTFTENKTFELQTTKVWTVRFDTTGMVGGSLSSTDAIKVDNGTKLSAANLPTPTPGTGYAFTGWKATNEIVDLDNTVTADITLTPVFTAQSYDFTKTANQSTVTVTGGLTADGKATYRKDITFTVTPENGYVVTDVRYTVGNGASTPLTASDSVYTIPGDQITGNVTVEVVTVKYVTVTFQAGAGNTLTGDATAYAKSGTAGLYTDTTFVTSFTVPTPMAQTGYRLADHTGESLWKTADGTGYTAESVKTATFSADTVLTAQSVKTYKVTFVSAEPAKATVTGSLTLDAGKTITEIPEATYTAGYTFKEWRIGGTAYASDKDLKAVAINSDTTVTLVAKDNSYTATLTGGAAAEITDVTGLTGDRAVHGTPITFKLTAKDGYKVTKVAYQIENGTAQEITAQNDIYTIPGDAITGSVALVLTTSRTYTITFAAGKNGTVTGTTSFVLDAGSKLTKDQLSTVKKTGNAGYTFTEWQIGGITKTENDILGTAFNANTTINAIFDHATYNVTATGISGVSDKATHGTNLTFTPTVDGKIVIGITAKIGETAVTVTKNADGSYTISGDAITGDLTITAQIVTGSWGFIDKDSYIALSTDKKIAVLATGKLEAGNYLLGDEGMYWSSKYNAYVKIVGKDESAETLTAKLAFNASVAAQTLSYTGDINGSNTVTPADGGMINDELQSVPRKYELTEKERLEMDVNGDKTVSTEDIVSILRKYVGLD